MENDSHDSARYHQDKLVKLEVFPAERWDAREGNAEKTADMKEIWPLRSKRVVYGKRWVTGSRTARVLTQCLIYCIPIASSRPVYTNNPRPKYPDATLFPPISFPSIPH